MIRKEYYYLEYPKDDVVNLEVLNNTLAEINQLPKDSASAYSFFNSSSDVKFACFENPISEIKNVFPLMFDSETKKFRMIDSAFSKNLYVFPLLTDISNATPNFISPPPPPKQSLKLKVHSFPAGYGVETELLKPKMGNPSLPLTSFIPSHSTSSMSSVHEDLIANLLSANTDHDDDDDDDDDDDNDDDEDDDDDDDDNKNTSSINKNFSSSDRSKGIRDDNDSGDNNDDDDSEDEGGGKNLRQNEKEKEWKLKKKKLKKVMGGGKKEKKFVFIKKEVEESIGIKKKKNKKKQKDKESKKGMKHIFDEGCEINGGKTKRKRDFENNLKSVVDKKKKKKMRMEIGTG